MGVYLPGKSYSSPNEISDLSAEKPSEDQLFELVIGHLKAGSLSSSSSSSPFSHLFPHTQVARAVVWMASPIHKNLKENLLADPIIPKIADLAKKMLWEFYILDGASLDSQNSLEASQSLKMDVFSVAKLMDTWPYQFIDRPCYKQLITALQSLTKSPRSLNDILSKYLIDKLKGLEVDLHKFLLPEIVELLLEDLRARPFLDRLLVFWEFKKDKTVTPYHIKKWFVDCYLGCYMSYFQNKPCNYEVLKVFNISQEELKSSQSKWDDKKCLGFMSEKFTMVLVGDETDQIANYYNLPNKLKSSGLQLDDLADVYSDLRNKPYLTSAILRIQSSHSKNIYLKTKMEGWLWKCCVISVNARAARRDYIFIQHQMGVMLCESVMDEWVDQWTLNGCEGLMDLYLKNIFELDKLPSSQKNFSSPSSGSSDSALHEKEQAFWQQLASDQIRSAVEDEDHESKKRRTVGDQFYYD